MRFRATLAPEQVSHLYALVGPLAKVATRSSHADGKTSSGGYSQGRSSAWAMNTSGTCFLGLDSEMMYVTLDLPPTDGMTTVRAAVQAQGGIFLEHRIESNATNHRIVLRVDLGQLRVALQSVLQQIQTKSKTSNPRGGASALFAMAQPSTLTVLKLAKRNQMPCLVLQAKTAYRMELCQTIPVQVQRATDDDELWEQRYGGIPTPAAPTVQLWLPPPAGLTLKAFVDAVVKSKHDILLTGRGNEMQLQLQHDNGAQLQTLLLGQAVDTDESTTTTRTVPPRATVRVRAAHVALALQHGAWTTEWSWIPNQALVVAVRLDPVGVVTYVLPVQYLEEEDDNDE